MTFTALPALMAGLLLAQVQTGPTTVLNNGACLDSPRAVPQALQAPPVRSMQVTRIDKVVSTQTMIPGETIGFLYTLGDGSTWLSQRTSDYMSSATATAINRVLASTHMPDQTISEFPPDMRYGVPTKYQQYFRVQIPPGAMTALQIRMEPCVAWPVGMDLPDPVL